MCEASLWAQGHGEGEEREKERERERKREREFPLLISVEHWVMMRQEMPRDSQLFTGHQIKDLEACLESP